MGALLDAKAHLVKAEEFLAAAEVTLDLELLDAAASSAVSCGIHAKAVSCGIHAKDVFGATGEAVTFPTAYHVTISR